MKKIQFFKLSRNFFKIDFIKEKITLNNAVITLFVLFCLYIIYLSVPSFYSEKLAKEKIKLEINRIYNSDSITFKKYSYSIFPKPHYKIEDVVIFKEKNIELAKIKKINLFISQKNFLKKNNIIIKTIQILEGNFYLNYKNYTNLKSYIKSNNIKFIQFKKGNFFIVDNNFDTIAIARINDFNLKYNKNKNANELFYKGQIFNLPFKIKYNINLYKKEADLLVNFKKINLNFKNTSKYYQSDEHLNEIQFLRTKFNSIIKYDNNKKIYNVKSKESVIQQTEIDYLGNLNFDPFYFNFKFNIDSIDYNKLFFINNFFEKFLIYYLLKNEYINGDIQLDIKNIKKHNLFSGSMINISINRGNFDLSNTTFDLRNIGELKILSSKVNSKDNKIELIFNLSLYIKNQKKLYQKFLIPKKNRKKVENVTFNLKLIPSSNEILISNFYIEKNKFNLFENKELSFNSWQEFRNFVNDVFSNYKG